MRLLTTAVVTSLTLVMATTGTPTAAQGPVAAAPAARQLKITPTALKAIIDLQTAVKAKNRTAIPGLVTAAQALAKTNDDRSAIAGFQLQAAIDANDDAGLVAAADAMRASGSASPDLTKIYVHAAQDFANAKQPGLAVAALDKAAAIDPGNVDVLVLKSDLAMKAQQPAVSVTTLNQAIARQKSLGQVVPESWYQAAVARAYEAKLPLAYEAARQWVAAYPSPQHWRDAINIYRNLSGLDRSALIDVFRLARLTKSLSGESDYLAASDTFSSRGFPGEAVSLLNEGAAAGSINLTSTTFARTFAIAKGKSLGDRVAATAAAKTALSAPSAVTTVAAADRLLGYGDFAQAATLYRAALGKTGADANLINLRLGEALAQSGDKSGSVAALSAVGGIQADIAKYWLSWVSTH